MTTQLFRNFHYRVLLHGQKDTTEVEDRRFFKEVVDKSICDAISSHNEAFVDVFHNTLKEAIHGFPVGQGRPAYYNIPDSSTQEANQVCTSHQEAAPAGCADVQTVQGSSEQTLGTTTDQTQHIPRPLVQHVQQ